MKHFIFCFILGISLSYGQHHEITADIVVSKNLKRLDVNSQIDYVNTTKKKLDTLYFYDWNNAFSDKDSPLAKRFAEEYARKFHFTSKELRGYTQLKDFYVSSQNTNWFYKENQPDILFIVLEKPLEPEDSVNLQLNYHLNIPIQGLVKSGWSVNKLRLKDWLITPAKHHKDWILYSNKALDDYPTQFLDYDLNFEIPKGIFLKSSFDMTELQIDYQKNKFKLSGKQILDNDVYLTRRDEFSSVKTDLVEVISNLESESVRPEIKALITDRVAFFLDEHIGKFPHPKLLVSELDYSLSPVYGLNQLPSFIRPFPDGFQYDVKLLKTMTLKYLKTKIALDTRKDKWLIDALTVKLMIDYIDKYYPDMKLLGSFSEFFGVRWFHASDLMFNDRYRFIHETMIRQNLKQPIDMPQDEMLKFNRLLSSPYQAGLGLKYLGDYIGQENLNQSIREFFEEENLGHASSELFLKTLEKNTDKDITWFKDNYLNSYKDIDFKVGKVSRNDQGFEVEVINKTESPMPVKLGLYKDDDFIKSIWVEDFEGHSKTLQVNTPEANKFVVNYDYSLPEYNARNNIKRKNKIFNKPIQVRLLEDIEDPEYNQVFVMPEFTYNLYDGIAVGSKIYNTSLLPKNFSYDIGPKYGFGSQAVVGSISFDYTQYFKQQDLFRIRYGASGSRYSYNTDLFYKRYSAFMQMVYRPTDLRSNKRHYLTLRTVNVDQDESETVETEEPNYNVFNITYAFQDKNLDHFFTTQIDYEISKKFSKVSASVRYRKLFENNRQINIRLFAGLFLYNDTNDSDYFSFGIDRPSDYMFDYNYYGRSEDDGLFSQQYIQAEGGFKSIFENRYADRWIATTNVSTTIWNWIFAYADLGFHKDMGESANFIYDSGIRLNLVEDYFELYFPIYSNNGWEVSDNHYDENIRFIVTLDFKTLFGLFKRKWY